MTRTFMSLFLLPAITIAACLTQRFGLLVALTAAVPFSFDALLFADSFGDEPATVVDDTQTAAVQPQLQLPSEEAMTDEQLGAEIEKLTSPEFVVRQEAAAKLMHLAPRQIRMIIGIAEKSEQVEVTQRIMMLLEQFYTSNNVEAVNAASEALEAAALNERWAIAEAAGDVLDRHWVKRFKLTESELREFGVFFNKFSLENLLGGRLPRGNFLFAGPVDSSMLQINLDQRWTGGDRGMALLTRLSDLAGPTGLIGTARIGVYLIDGHPLDDKAVTQLKATFGDARVVSRGKVCLGITNDPTGGDTIGCRVAEVRPGTSAHKGGVMSQDLIVAVDDVRIKDFDHLVDLLKKYEIDTVVRMEILRGGSIYQRFDAPRQPFGESPDEESPDSPYRTRRLVLNVKLLGWDAQDQLESDEE